MSSFGIAAYFAASAAAFWAASAAAACLADSAAAACLAASASFYYICCAAYCILFSYSCFAVASLAFYASTVFSYSFA